jgi:ribosome-associated protein
MAMDTNFADDERLLTVAPELRIPRAEFQFTFVRSSGPGGQNVNKVNSKAQLRWPVRQSPSLPEPVRQRFLARHGSRLTEEGDLLIVSQRYRDQPRNVDDCLDKLRQMLFEVLHPPKRRKKTKPGKGAIERRLKAKRQQTEKMQGRRQAFD